MIFVDRINSSTLYIDLIKSLVFKYQYVNSYQFPNYIFLNFSFSLMNLDNSNVLSLFNSLNLFYELVGFSPYLDCGHYRWLRRGKSLGVTLFGYNLNYFSVLLLLRIIFMINRLRFEITLKSIKLFRNKLGLFYIGIPFYDVTKTSIITTDLYFEWKNTLIFQLHTNTSIFRELRYLLKLLIFFIDKKSNRVLNYLNRIPFLKNKDLSILTKKNLILYKGLEQYRNFYTYIFYFYETTR